MNHEPSLALFVCGEFAIFNFLEFEEIQLAPAPRTMP